MSPTAATGSPRSRATSGSTPTTMYVSTPTANTAIASAQIGLSIAGRAGVAAWILRGPRNVLEAYRMGLDRGWPCVNPYPCGAADAVSAQVPGQAEVNVPAQGESDRGTEHPRPPGRVACPHDGRGDARCPHPTAAPGADAHLAAPSDAPAAHAGVHTTAAARPRVDRAPGRSLSELNRRPWVGQRAARRVLGHAGRLAARWAGYRAGAWLP